MTNSTRFYLDLPSFTDIENLTEEDYFYTVPEDWYIILTDVKGSTKAIEEGRYKDVNTVGVATITSIKNSLPGFEFPFVFGGDGATLLVPEEHLIVVESTLSELSKLSSDNFKLELRIAKMKCQQVYASGLELFIGKFKNFNSPTLAMFKGNGFIYAEKEIKKNYENYKIKKNDQLLSSPMDGLSCRWNAIPSKNGKVISILLQARLNHEEVYRKFIVFLKNELGDDFQSANPVNIEKMTYRSFIENIIQEWKFLSHIFSVKTIKRLTSIFISQFIFSWGFIKKMPNMSAYLNEVPQHSDFRKFDGLLRLVLDCTEAQIQKIHAYLAQAHQRGELNYGTHLSKESLLTCYVENMSSGGHIHFVDGADGGYAMAAKMLKQQLSSNVSQIR